MEHYKIGELVKKLNINKETIRYYERFGLLSEPKRDSNGYRIYGEVDIEMLQFIIIAKNLGFKLKEIKYFIDEGILTRGVKDIKFTVDKKIKELNMEIAKIEEKKNLLNRVNEILDSENIPSCNKVKEYLTK